MRYEFVDSKEAVFDAAIEVLRLIGKALSLDKDKRAAVGLVKNGVDLAWEPVEIHIIVEAADDRTVLIVTAEQRQLEGIPDSRPNAIQVFDDRILRRKDLTILD